MVQYAVAKNPYLIGMILIFFASPVFSQGNEDIIYFRDAKRYLEAIENAKEVKLSEQHSIWKNFLAQYPDTTFRSEIEHNMKQLEKALGVAQGIQKDLSDTEVFLKAKSYIQKKNLNKQDQLLLWKQFLGDHPDNEHNSEVKTLINQLTFELKKK